MAAACSGRSVRASSPSASGSVRHLAEELEQLNGDVSLPRLLDRFPATAELYENLNYRHAGLCRSPLEPALGAEVQARQAIERARRGGSD